MSDIIVELTVKENCGSFRRKIDVFSGSPEECAIILERKYCNTKSLFSRMYKSLDIAEREMVQWLNNKK